MYMMPTKNERSDYPSISNANDRKKSSSKCTDLSIAFFEETKLGHYDKLLVQIYLFLLDRCQRYILHTVFAI